MIDAIDMIDIRCRAIDPSTTRSQGRCQLTVGHEGDHALMYCREHVRMVRRWSGSGSTTTTAQTQEQGERADRTYTDRPAGQDGLPWMRGLPMPAWTEPEPHTQPQR